MRVTRVVLTFILFLSTSPHINSQQTAPTPHRDPGAISVLNQTLAAASANSTIASVKDFAGTGSITYYWAGTQDQGAATIRALSTSHFRLDATLAEGVRSWVTTPGGSSIKEADGKVSPILWHNTIHLGALSLPHLKVASVLNDLSWSLQNSGTDSFSGQRVFVIHAQQTTGPSTDPGGIFSHLSAMDFLVDSTTYQIVAIIDALHPPNDSMRDIEHHIEFSDYRVVNGFLVPFNLSDVVSGQITWSLQLSTVTFNTGLTNSDFQL